MKFVPLRNLTHKQLIQYGVIGIVVGALLNILSKAQAASDISVFIEILSGAAQLLGWVYLIWGVIRWAKERKTQP